MRTFTPLTTMLALLLLTASATAQWVSHPQTVCSFENTVPIADIEPFLSQYDFYIDCYARRHSLPPTGNSCTKLWTNGKEPNLKIAIRVCPQETKDPLTWRDGVGYGCLEVANVVRKLVAECGRDGRVAGKANLGPWGRGYVEVRKKDWLMALLDLIG
ncbi:uncharacterized protein H6S33_006873 [Morchella sextelata]|uniref:uncharacterized protein n=1 Tax=Morchella sextelata TaxID=1174677 RepID=UPI001D058A88|nr:uncharacterized protein H6S33_006873 [Morchella sextelata]KAH0604496.1 hypothetical protein H6S33_006873 [Morchella sextelata]